MKVFSSEFEDILVNAIGIAVLVSIGLLIIGVVGGIESGLIWR